MAATIIIEAGRLDRHYWREVWRFRELFRVLTWRDLSIRYKQTAIGIFWALIRPFLATMILTIVFGKLARLPSDAAAPYMLMVAIGMLPWTLFAGGLADGSNALTVNSNLVSKVYFPRIIIPAAAIVVALVDFAFSMLVLVGLLLWYGVAPDWRSVFLPVFLALACVATLGPTLWFAALNVRYRDFRYVIPFVVQLGLYLSPVAFSSSIVPPSWRPFFYLNPMASVIDGFRWCILGPGTEIYLPGLVAGTAISVVVLWLGITFFKEMERGFADHI